MMLISVTHETYNFGFSEFVHLGNIYVVWIFEKPLEKTVQLDCLSIPEMKCKLLLVIKHFLLVSNIKYYFHQLYFKCPFNSGDYRKQSQNLRNRKDHPEPYFLQIFNGSFKICVSLYIKPQRFLRQHKGELLKMWLGLEMAVHLQNVHSVL